MGVMKAVLISALALALAVGGGFLLLRWLGPIFPRNRPASGGPQAAAAAAQRETGKLNLAAPPITVPPPGQAVAIDQDACVRWGRKNLREAYDSVGRRNSRWDEAARKFIDRSILWLAGDPAGPDARMMAQEANVVLQLGCDDPLIYYLGGRARFETDGQDTYVEALLTRAVTGFETTRYPRGVARFAAAALVAEFKRRRFTPPLRARADALMVKWIQESMTDDSYGRGDEAVFMNHFAKPGSGREYVDAHSAEFAAWVNAVAVFPDWLKRYFSGRQFFNEAWKARGTDYANKVPAESWKNFGELMSKARRDLEASWREEPRRPEAAALMISVVNSGGARGAENERAWFDRTVAAQFDYLPAYESMAWALRPRWGGSLAAMQVFGLACAATVRTDTAVPAFLLRVVEEIDGEYEFMQKSKARAMDNPATAAAVEAMLEAYEKSPLPAALIGRYRTRYAMLLMRQKQADKAAKQLERNGWRALPPATLHAIDDVAYDEDDTHVGNELVGRAQVLAGPAAAVFAAAEDSARAGRMDEAALKYREARQLLAGKTDAANARAVELVEARGQASEDELRLRRGEWVRYMPAPSLSGWRAHLGTWQVETDGALRVSAGSCGTMLVRQMPIGPNFEIRGTIEFIGKPTIGEEVLQAGVVAGFPDFGQSQWASARIWRDVKNPTKSQVRVARGFFGQSDFVVEAREENTFLARCVGGKWSFELNGKMVCENVAITGREIADPRGQVGFGAYAAGYPAEMRYRNIELRRLGGAR